MEDWYSEDLLYADRLSRPIKLLRILMTNACALNGTRKIGSRVTAM